MSYKPTLAAIVVLAGLPAEVFAGGGPALGIDPLVPQRAIVRVAVNTADAQADLNAFLAAFNAQYPGTIVLDSIPAVRTYLLQVPKENPVAMANAIDSYAPAYLTWGELLYEGQAPEGKTGTTWVDDLATPAQMSGQYAGGLIGLPAAHARTRGIGTVVAVLDTGIDVTHPALAGSIAPGGFNFIANNTNLLDIGDGIDSDGDQLIDEMTGHGTYVAGLVHFAAPDAKILPIIVLNSDGVGDGWTFAKGMRHAIDHGVEVINLSLGSTYKTQAVEEAIDDALDLGITVVAAAGNFNRDDPQEHPAMDNGPFGIAATNPADKKALFSNFHSQLFLSAPGASVPVGAPNPATSLISTLPGNKYGIWEGTSFAVPLVSGTIAMLRAQHPEWTASRATSTGIGNLLRNTAVNIDNLNPAYEDELGKGRLNAGGAAAAGPIALKLGDLNVNGIVNIDDLLAVLGAWGQVHSSADLNGDGTVGIDDLLALLKNWG